VLSGNTVSNNAESRIGLQRATTNELLGNTANGYTLDGIQLQVGSISNELRGSTANVNGRSGIHAFLGATGNTIEENSMHGNGWNENAIGPRVDAREDNPLLDGALQNGWIDNDCDTDFPAGTICGLVQP
jgi:Periplasmic copper-binding protein (NosD)